MAAVRHGPAPVPAAARRSPARLSARASWPPWAAAPQRPPAALAPAQHRQQQPALHRRADPGRPFGRPTRFHHHGARAAVPPVAQRHRQARRPRAQVLVESLIVEVNTNKLAEFGIQWQMCWASGDGTVGVMGTNWRRSAPTSGRTTALALGQHHRHRNRRGPLSGGPELALAPRVGGSTTWGRWPTSCKTAATPTCFHPNLMTLDNEEAKIIVIGNNVPFCHRLVCQQHRAAAPSTLHHGRAQGRGSDAARAPADQRERNGQDGDLPGPPRSTGHAQVDTTSPPPASAPSSPTCWWRTAASSCWAACWKTAIRPGRGQGACDGRHPGAGQPVPQREPLAQEDQPDGILRPGGGARRRRQRRADARPPGPNPSARCSSCSSRPSTVMRSVSGAPSRAGRPGKAAIPAPPLIQRSPPPAKTAPPAAPPAPPQTKALPPSPFARARLLLEDDGQQLVLWHGPHPTRPRSARCCIGATRRAALQALDARHALAQRISARLRPGRISAATVVSEVEKTPTSRA